MSETCSNCHYWKHHGDAHYGECRRYGPILKGEGTPTWPITDRYEWCGEWQHVMPLGKAPL